MQQNYNLNRTEKFSLLPRYNRKHTRRTRTLPLLRSASAWLGVLSWVWLAGVIFPRGAAEAHALARAHQAGRCRLRAHRF